MIFNEEYLKVSSALTTTSVSAPGTKLNADMTLNQSKQPGIKMYMREGGNVLFVELQGQKIIIPLANIRSLILE